jgi:tetratricopeptide (TPR) repeat protein
MVSFMSVMVCLLAMAVFTASGAAETGSSSLDAVGSTRLEDAKRLVGEGKCSEAIPLLEEMAASDAASAPQALKMMGDCYKAQQNWANAIEAFEKLLAAYPNSAAPDREVKAWIMDCYLAKGDLEKCLFLRKQLLGEYRTDAWKLYYIVGRRRFWNHEYSKAIPELKQAVELGADSKSDPDFIEANRCLVRCYLVEKEWDKAEQLANELLEAYPDRAYEWHLELGKYHQGREEYDKAIECLELAAKTCPKSYYNAKEIFTVLLECYDTIGRSDQAIFLSQKLIEDYPDEPFWKWKLGFFYVCKGEYAKAVSLFQKVIESSKTQWEIRSSQIFLGQCLFKLGRGKEALEGIESYYKARPELWDEHLLVKAAVLFYGPADYAGCIEKVEELIARSDQGQTSSLVPTARELLYKSLEKTGDFGGAASTLETLATESKDLAWLGQAARDYYKAKNYKEARRVCKEVMNGSNVPHELTAQCMRYLALCYWETGLKEAGKRLMLKVSEQYPNTEAGMQARGSLYLWSRGK